MGSLRAGAGGSTDGPRSRRFGDASGCCAYSLWPRPIGFANADVIRLTEKWQITADPDELDRVQPEIAGRFRTDLPVTILSPAIVTTFAGGATTSALAS